MTDLLNNDLWVVLKRFHQIVGPLNHRIDVVWFAASLTLCSLLSCHSYLGGVGGCRLGGKNWT